MAVLSTLKHHGSYDRTCLIYDNLCLYITVRLKILTSRLHPAKSGITALRGESPEPPSKIASAPEFLELNYTSPPT